MQARRKNNKRYLYNFQSSFIFMNKKGHLILAVAIALVFMFLNYNFNWNLIDSTWKSFFLILGVSCFYCLLPDIDHKNSTITWTFFGIGVLGLTIAMIELLFDKSYISPLRVFIFSGLLLIATFLSANLFSHRGIVHTVQSGIIASIPIGILLGNFVYSLFAYIAWHSHLLGDRYLFKIR